MKTLYGAAPLHQRLQFLHLPADERLRQRFRNLVKLRCCPVCARPAAKGFAFCAQHQHQLVALDQQRHQRLTDENRCQVCERVMRYHSCPECRRHNRTVESRDGLPLPLAVYQLMVDLHEAGF